MCVCECVSVRGRVGHSRPGDTRAMYSNWPSFLEILAAHTAKVSICGIGIGAVAAYLDFISATLASIAPGDRLVWELSFLS